VADFYAAVMAALSDLGLPVTINEVPNEIPDAMPFSQDTEHAAYNPEYAQRFWQVLLQTDLVFRRFRAPFIGKVSPVHFFWGGMDLAVTRFSGRTAPRHPGGVPNLPDWVAREAYSHEVSSAGSGREAGRTRSRFFTATPIPSPKALPTRPSCRRGRSTAKSYVSSCCPTTWCGRPALLRRHSSPFYNYL
jgi:hypothetical protein